MQQVIKSNGNNYHKLDECIKKSNYKKILLVCGNSIKNLNINNYFCSLESRLGVKVVRFSDFQPNPQYESVVKGVKLLNDNKCDLIVAVGGGSAIDVAKCIKLFSNMNDSENFLNQDIVPNNVGLFAIPTTAGTGSEATKFAVIYVNGEKQSISHVSCIPSVVVFVPDFLKTLSCYQKKATMLDALCHATESLWSVNSTEESQIFAIKAIKIIMSTYQSYLNNSESVNSLMLEASNLAGKAINISKTTAGHAMCYKLTSLYNIAHGHAAALCVCKLFYYTIQNKELCDDNYCSSLNEGLNLIADAYGCNTPEEAADKFSYFMAKLNLMKPIPVADDYKLLAYSVNPERLKNYPLTLNEDVLLSLYHEILDK